MVGVFGLFEGRLDNSSTAPHPYLTPRQVEVLRLLEQGRSTKQIAYHFATHSTRAIVADQNGQGRAVPGLGAVTRAARIGPLSVRASVS